MNNKFSIYIAAVFIFAGCSKKEESAESVKPPAAAVNSNAVNAGLNPAPARQTLTNVTATTAAVASNVIASAEAKSVDAQNALQAATSASNAAPAAVLNKLPALSNQAADTTPPATAIPATSQGAGAASLADSTLPSLAGLSTDQLTQGLKEALAKGLQQAVASLGQPGGFLGNAAVKIPLPAKLQSVEKTLRAIGQGPLVDQCITTMNQAAEQAVPVAADVFAGSLKNMSVDDAKAILNGAPDAATQYFRRTTQAELTAKFMPIIQQAMGKTGATAAYEQVMDKAKVASPFFSAPSLDLNAYVTGKALDGLFKLVADEEKNIRANPVARSTEVLKSVFGAFQK